jgi:hypothetical protein
MPYNVSFGLIYDMIYALLFTGVDQKSGKKVYFYNLRIIANTFEQRRSQMMADKTPNSLFNWILEVCSLYINPFVYEYVVNVQHTEEKGLQIELQHILLGDL